MKENHGYSKLVEVSKVEIGISSALKWVFKVKQLIYEYDKGNDKEIIFWLPLLEMPYRDLLALLEIGCKRVILDATVVNQFISSFPTYSILNTALESNSEFWVNLALGWCEDIDDLKDQRERLEIISKDKNYSQSLRHKALKLLKKTK